MSKKLRFLLIMGLVCSLLLLGCDKERETELFQRNDIENISELMNGKGFDSFDISQTTCQNGSCFFAVEGYQNENKECYIYQIYEKEMTEKIKLNILPEIEINGFDVGINGNYYLLEERYDEEEAGNSYLVIINDDGMIVSESNINEALNNEEKVTMIQVGKDNEVYLFCESGKICVLDDCGKWKYDINEHQGEMFLDANHMSDESIVFVSVQYLGDKEKMNVYQVQDDSDSTEFLITLKSENYGSNILINGVGKYDFYLRDDKYISAFSCKEKESIPIMSWEENDFVSDSTEKICAVTEDKWLALEKDSESHFVYMEKENEETSVKKQKLQLACLHADSILQKQVADFNKENSEYKIEIISYDEEKSSNQAFLIDIATRKDIDIIIIPKQDEEVLFEKEILEDLYSFMEKDEKICKDDFLPNILKAYEQNGKLYQTVSRVNILGWITKESYLDKKDSWTQDSMKKMIQEHPDAELFKSGSSEEIMETFLEGMLVSFIDWNDGTCKFQSEEFYDLMRTAKEKGNKQGEIPNEEIVQNLKEEKLLFSKTVINPYEVELYSTALNDDFSIVGASFAEGTGCTFWSSDIQCGISVNSDNKDAAWQFVRNYFSKEYQDLSENTIMFGMSEEGIPIRKDCFEEYIKRFTAVDSYEKNGQWIEPIQGTVATSVFDYEATPMNRKQEEIFRIIVTETTKKQKMDEKIMKIILEEATLYFKNEKECEEVAEIIQNRVSNYLKEKEENLNR